MTVSLVALRAFETAARQMSFKAAAVELNLSATAISHQIKSLEKALGQQLFNREIRKVTLTAEGEELARTLTPAFESINGVVRKLQSTTGRYTVTLGTGPIFGARWIAPRLGLFWQQNPDIDLRLHHSPLRVPKQMASYDIAVAWGIGDWPGLQADPLLNVQVTPVYAPNARFISASINTPEALLHYPLLHHRDHSAWRLWLESVGVQPPAKMSGVVFDDANVQLQAALEGQGIALGFLPLIKDEIATGRLIQPWAQTVNPPESYFLLYHPHSLARHPVARVRQWLLSID